MSKKEKYCKYYVEFRAGSLWKKTFYHTKSEALEHLRSRLMDKLNEDTSLQIGCLKSSTYTESGMNEFGIGEQSACYIGGEGV